MRSGFLMYTDFLRLFAKLQCGVWCWCQRACIDDEDQFDWWSIIGDVDVDDVLVDCNDESELHLAAGVDDENGHNVHGWWNKNDVEDDDNDDDDDDDGGSVVEDDLDVDDLKATIPLSISNMFEGFP